MEKVEVDIPGRHGEMDRKRIESVVGETPTIVWHRSFHELYMSKSA